MTRVSAAAAAVLNPLAWLADFAHWGVELGSLGMLALRLTAGLMHVPVFLACKYDDEPAWLEKATAASFIVTALVGCIITTAVRPTSVAAQGGSLLMIILLYSLVFPGWRQFRTLTFMAFSAAYVAVGFYWRGKIGYGAKHEIFTISIFLSASSIMAPRLTQRIESAEQSLVDAKTALQQTVAELQSEVALRKAREHSLEQARHEAEAASLAKTRFLANVSHELRTPLTGISGSLRLLAALPMDDERRKVLLDACSRNSNRLLGLVETLLDAQTVQSGDFQVTPEPIALRTLIQESEETSAGLASHHNVTFHFETQPDHLWLSVDAKRFHQILTNLLSNAARHSPDGGDIHIRCTPNDDANMARIEVEDKGSGVPESFRPHIFKRFSTTAKNNERGSGGTGLGLAITKTLVEAHDGRIGFESKPGAGSTFWFELALVPPTPRKSASGLSA